MAEVKDLVEEIKKATQQEIADGTRRAFGPRVGEAAPPSASASTNNPAGAPPQDQQQASAEANTGDNATASSQQQQAQDPPPTENPAPIDFSKLSDEEKENIYNQLTGGKKGSLKEALEDKAEPTAEEKEALAKKKRQEGLQWALGTGKVKQEDYDRSVIVKDKTNHDIALDLFTKEIIEESPSTTAEEAAELFRAYYMVDGDEKDVTRKMRQKEMNRIADNYRAGVLAPVSSIDSDYDTYQSGESRFKNYKTQVDGIFEKLATSREIATTYMGPDGKELAIKIPYGLDEAQVKSLKRYIGSREIYSALGGDGKALKESDITGAIEFNIAGQTFANTLSAVAKAAAETASRETQAYYKAIPRRTESNPLTGVNNQQTATGNGRTRVFSEEVRNRFPTKTFNRN